jgi:hypothetical protein
MNLELIRTWLPIAISGFSLILASLALGWNIYRDIILKARVIVSFATVDIITPGAGPLGHHGRCLRVSATNHGPGPVTIQMITGRISPWWRTLLRRPQHLLILNDHTNPLNPKLPERLDVGDTLTLLLPYDAKCFLSTSATHIGVSDSFGREHFAPRAQVRVAKRSFRSVFPKAG